MPWPTPVNLNKAKAHRPDRPMKMFEKSREKIGTGIGIQRILLGQRPRQPWEGTGGLLPY
jgi:hypothetical protein